MKKFYHFTMQALVCILLTVSLYAQQTVPVNLTPTGTIGACSNNLFTAKFKANGTHRFTVHAYITVNGLPINYYSCTAPANAPRIFIAFNSVSGATISSLQTDTIGGTWTANFNYNDTVVLSYHIYVDCSVIPTSTNNPPVNLVQVLTDSTGNFNYQVIGGTNDTLQTSNIKTPYITDISSSVYYASYLDTSDLVFLYKNAGTSVAEMKFHFFPDPTNYCNQLPTAKLEYAQGNGAPFQNLNAGQLTTATIQIGDTLIIRQRVTDSLCIKCDTACFGLICKKNATMTWQCNNLPSDIGTFCNECINIYHSNYQVLNGDTPVFKLERILPVSANYDISCYNDTANMVQWQYRITNAGKGALDSVFIDLTGNVSALNFLTLIPRSSFLINTNNPGLIVNLTDTPRTASLCTSFIPLNNQLANAKIKIKNFHETDTVTISFRTFRCSEENDAALLNVDKYYNHWTLPVGAKSVCGNNASRIGYPLYGVASGISSNFQNGNGDIDQDLLFLPTVTDLSISPGQTFGDHAVMDVSLQSIVETPNFDYQLLGYNGVGNVNPRGYIRAVVHCNLGLRIEHPDSEAVLKLPKPGTNTFIYHYPVYYYTTVPDSICLDGDYYFYFDLQDSASLSFLTAGFFEYTLQACCGGNQPATPYNVSFYLMANTDSCFTLAFTDTTHTTPPSCTSTIPEVGCSWLPLSSSGYHIYTHCPGCRHPGLIVDDYKIERTTYGLQDSDNDGRCDSTFTQITPGSAWFNNNIQVLKPNNSSFGDEITDLLLSHFQEGDASYMDSTYGYTYQQMTDLGVYLPYLQLSRKIPAALDTMKLLPLEFTLYIDTPDTVHPNCKDCSGYNTDTLKYRTQEVLHVTDTAFSGYLAMTTSANRYLFTFSSLDSSGTLIGNLHNNPYITFNDSLSPFTGFFEMQQYRLKVRYKECGNFVLSPTAIFDLDNVMKRSEILNQMWLSGKPQSYNAYSNIPQSPNTVAELDSLNWTLDSLDLLNTLINDSFASAYLFYCETFGGIHYFYSQDARNLSGITNGAGCSKSITVSASGYTGGNITNVYPFEYRPAALWSQEYRIEVPPDYKIINSTVQNSFHAAGATRFTNLYSFTSPQDTGTFILQDSILPQPACLSQNKNFPLNASDTLQYAGSGYTNRTIIFTLVPDSCEVGIFYPPDSSVIINFNKEKYSCINDAGCSLDSALSRIKPHQTAPLVIMPNVQVAVAPNSVSATHHQICTTVYISNPSVTFPGNINSTATANIFIAVSDSQAVPFLSNWTFTITSTNPDTILYPYGNEIFHVADNFPVNFSVTGNLCAFYNDCLGDTSFL
jgi:hypothetical protein